MSKRKREVTPCVPLVKKFKGEEAAAALWQEIKSEERKEEILINYITTNPSCKDILSLITEDHYNQDNVLLCFLLLEQILLVAADDTTPIDSTHLKLIGERLSYTLLTDHGSAISYSLSRNRLDQVTAASLRLITAIIVQGEKLALDVLDKLDFGSNRLRNLPIRDQTLEDGQDSVRVCYIKLGIAFLIIGSHKVIKQILPLKKLLHSLFRKLANDPVDLVLTFINLMKDKIIINQRVTRKDKLLVFDRQNVKHLVRLGCSASSDDSGLTDAVFELLKELPIHLSFQPYNVLMCEDKSNNPVLLQLLHSLSLHFHHPLVPLLVKSIISSCPNLFHHFFKLNSLFDIDLKPTEKWLTQIKLMTSLLNDCSYFDEVFMSFSYKDFSSLYCYLTFVHPSLLTRTILSSGVQNSCLVIKNATLCMLNSILKRSIALYKCIKAKLPNGSDTEWNRFCDTLFSCLPDVQSIMTARHTALSLLKGKNPSFVIPPEEINIITLNEELSKSSEVLFNSVSVLYHYQYLLPTCLAGITVTKLVTEIFNSYNNNNSNKGAGLESQVLLASVQIISKAPVDLICNSVKGEFVQCMIDLLQYDSLHNETIKALVKCFRTYPHLFDYETELVQMCHTFARHLFQLPLYSTKERDNLKKWILLAISEVTKKSFLYWFDLICFLHVGKQDEWVCPLLTSLINMFTGSPSVARCILLSHVIMNTVNISSDPITMASSILTKLEGIENKENTYQYRKYLALLFSYLWARSNSKKQLQLSFDNDVIVPDGNDDPVLLREYVLHQLVLFPDQVMELSASEGCYGDVTVALLEVLPIPVYINYDECNDEDKEKGYDQSIECGSSAEDITEQCNGDSNTEKCMEMKERSVIDLLSGYKATLSDKDVSILLSLHQYEENTEKSILSSYNPLLWGHEACRIYKERERKNWLLWEQPTVQDVMSLLSEKLVMASLKKFPFDRLLEPIDVHDAEEEKHLYDPCFILPLISSLLSSDSSVNYCHSLIRKGLLSYTIKATSSICPNMRRVAYHILSLFKELLPASNFRETPQLVIFMEVFSNSVPDCNTRLPVVISSFFSKVCQLFLHPDNALFPVVGDFLLERPLVDIRKVPLCDSMLQSPHYKERHWMFELLQEGLANATPTDYQLYKKNGVFTDLKICHASPLIAFDQTLHDLVTSFTLK